MTPAHRYPQQRQAGLSLVELMIAVVLGLLLVAGILTLFVNSRAAYNTQAGLAEMQEQARFALEDIARNVRAASFRGCARGDGELEYLTKTDNGNHNKGFDRWIDGYNSTGDSFEPALRSNMGNSNPFVDGSDVLVLRTAEDGDVFLAATMASLTSDLEVTPGKVGDASDKNAVTRGDVVVLTDCLNSTVFQVSGADPAANTLSVSTGGNKPGNDSANFVKAYEAGAQLFRLEAVTYGVRKRAADDYSGLWRRTQRGEGNSPDLSTSGAGAYQEIVPGVEQMQVLFGHDTDDDQVADAYVTADAVTGTVVAVRVSLLVSSLSDLPIDVDTRAITVGDVVVPAANDRRLRRVFTKTIALRNQLP